MFLQTTGIIAASALHAKYNDWYADLGVSEAVLPGLVTGDVELHPAEQEVEEDEQVLDGGLGDHALVGPPGGEGTVRRMRTRTKSSKRTRMKRTKM